MLSNDCVVLPFSPVKNKYGYSTTKAPITIPSGIKTSSLLYIVAKMVTDNNLGEHSSSIRWLINNLSLFPEFEKPLSSLTLDMMMALRIKLHEAKNDKVISLPNGYVSSLCYCLKRIQYPLACGRYVNQWGRFKAESSKKMARQIEGTDLVWEQIKSLDSVDEAKHISQERIKNLFDQYFNAAWNHIKAYQELLKASENLLIKGEIVHDSRKHKKVFTQFKRLGSYQLNMGNYQLFLSENWRGVLSHRTLLCILIICKLSRPLNTDTWLNLHRRNFKFHKTFIEISSPVKDKTNTHLSSFRVLNRDREFFTALNLLKKHYEVTRRLVSDLGIKTIREPFIFDYVTSMGNTGEPCLNRDFQYLKMRGYQRFIEDNCLNYISLDTLRNLSATKRFLEGSDIRDIQQILGHSHLSTTQHYIEQHVTSAYLRHNILIFMREFEQEAVDLFGAVKFTDELDAGKRSGKYFLIGDGSSCVNPKESPDTKQELGELCNGKFCHSSCKNNKTVLSEMSIWQALVKREEYRTSWFQTYSHEERFGAFEAKKVLYNALLCQYIAEKVPRIYNDMMEKITNRIKAKERL
ncbi:MAG: tyrosine-type recombinase/integrase [Gammaproteobacteria bacterium]|nr:tyrosine-type recombinase/integrase [Gammaproteobacteria bacterium]